jgi:hypothetical protein
MKKKILLLSTLGAAGGLLYLLESQRRNKTAPKDGDNGAAGNVRSSDAKKNGRRRSAKAASMARVKSDNEPEHAIDDQGTDQAEASNILKHIRDNAFEASDEKLALALGRPAEEIEEWTSGNGRIDGDVILKARTLALQRGFEI